ncbi:VanZ family protein [Georgenia wangjunii]|uniref:VanZ family protein n=1 Tax=Georgenia wangjunii TaxID=3117730 RepID=UPI002F25F031
MRPSLRRALLVLAIGAHLLALYAPRVPSTGAEGVPGSDKLVHAAVFALVALTGMLAGVPARVLVPLLLAHAVVSELVQHALLPNRSGDVWDAVADVVGVALGWALGRALSARRDPRAARGPSGPDR